MARNEGESGRRPAWGRTATYYSWQARRLKERARMATDPLRAEHLDQLAREYEALAERAERDGRS